MVSTSSLISSNMLIVLGKYCDKICDMYYNNYLIEAGF